MTNSSIPFSKHARIKARRSAVQALYQWHMTKIPMADVIAEFENEQSRLKKADIDYFRELLQCTAKRSD